MKVFVSDVQEEGYIDKYSYHYTKNGEILMFGLFQVDHTNDIIYSMVGITSRKQTTYITVKDIDISEKFFKELLSESICSSYDTIIDKDGFFDIQTERKYTFNINRICKELLTKANQYDVNDKLICVNRSIYYSNYRVENI